jgi:predicted DNA-binding transcriptional regulator AlpA
MPSKPNSKKRPRTYVCRSRAVGTMSTVVVATLRAHFVSKGRDPSEVPDIDPRIMRPAEIAALLGIHESTYWRMVAAGQLPAPIPIDRASFAKIDTGTHVPTSVSTGNVATNPAITPPAKPTRRTNRRAVGAPP